MLLNIVVPTSIPFVSLMVIFTKLYVHINLHKIAWLNKRITIYLMLLIYTIVSYRVLCLSWTNVILTIALLIDRVTLSTLDGQSPCLILFLFQVPFPLIPCIFGCVCYVYVLGLGSDKLSSLAIQCLFRDTQTQKGYQCFDLVKCRTFRSTNITFYLLFPSSLSSLTIKVCNFSPPSSIGLLSDWFIDALHLQRAFQCILIRQLRLNLSLSHPFRLIYL